MKTTVAQPTKSKLVYCGVTAACVAALASGGALASLAYLQDDTQMVKNTFTAGQVSFDEEVGLVEHVTDEYGNVEDPSSFTEEGNTYNLVPGHSYTKDPTVTIEAGSEDSYVFLVVYNPISKIETGQTIATQMTAAGWTKITNANTAIKGTVYAYNSIVKKSDTDTTLSSFTSFTVKNTLGASDIEPYSGKEIDVSAYAVQADGFEDAASAWNATFGA